MSSMQPIILYDGVCGLCNRLVKFVLKRDQEDRFRFAKLQSNFARELLQQHHCDPNDIDTFFLTLDYGQPNQRLLSRNDASAAVLEELGGIWRVWGRLIKLFPRHVRDWQYNLIARNRYRLFGRYESCPIPDPTVQHKFLDLP
ncbi:MAG: thiol-disulfide oxidoreductase [Acidobacteria bacterium]|nr:MAG: thiol-disulfide oxidoreductase [Acidobacteriota bacterium]PYV74718.1 MAG: thiol-disulfide oxidoreductase [Acidobacteriota bacterium]PYV76389.1 MAG: thiol-disulfide oxidoreductase [Acidobacteriota bacterium]